jgi:hypothetical protein
LDLTAKTKRKKTTKPNTSHHSPKELGEKQSPPIQTERNKISTAQKAEREAKYTVGRRVRRDSFSWTLCLLMVIRERERENNW